MPNKKVKSNEKRSADTKEKIRKCAEVLFRERGFEDTSVNLIVQKAGISKGTFYVHYDSKDSLVADFITNTIGWMDSSYDAVLDSCADGIPVSEVLLSLVKKVSHNITADLGYTIVQTVGSIQIRKTTNYDMLLTFNKGLYASVYKLVKKGIEQGEFKTLISAESVAEDIVTAIRGFIFEWIVRYPNFDLNDCLRKHFEIYLAGLQAKHK